MTMIDTGIYGAKVQSWRAHNPRDLLMRLLKENPGADKSQALALLWEALQTRTGKQYLFTIVEYWNSNNYDSVVRPRDFPTELVESKKKLIAQTETFKSKIRARVVHEARIILLDMVMPTGKTLRESTGAECRKIGGWFSQVASKIKPNQKVGLKFSEESIREIYAKAR